MRESVTSRAARAPERRSTRSSLMGAPRPAAQSTAKIATYVNLPSSETSTRSTMNVYSAPPLQQRHTTVLCRRPQGGGGSQGIRGGQEKAAGKAELTEANIDDAL